MRAFVICLMTVGLVVFSAKARADGGDKQSSETAEGNPNPAHDANSPANEVVPSKSKDASLEVEIQQLRDLVQSQAQELESQRSTLRKAIGEQKQEIERLREELQESRSGSVPMAAERASVMVTPVSAPSNARSVQASVAAPSQAAEQKPASPSFHPNWLGGVHSRRLG